MNTFLSLLLLAVLVHQVRSSSPTAACEAALPKYLADFEAGRTPQPLPIPSTEFLPQLRPVGYNLKEIRRGVYTVHDGGFFMILIYRGRSLVILDSPDGGSFAKRDQNGNVIGTLTTDAITEVLNGSIPRTVDLIYSHSHFDHIGTSTLTINFIKRRYPRARRRIWASKGTLKTLKLTTSGRAPLPTHIFRKDVILRFGPRYDPIRLYLKVLGGHTEDDTLVYIMKQRREPGVVFFVDVIFPGWAPFRAFAVTQDLAQYIRAHDIVLKLNFDVFVGGHLTRTGTRRDVVKSKQFTEFVINATRTSLRIAPSFNEAAAALGIFDPKSRNFSNIWLGFERSFDALEKDCTLRVVREWGCKLASVDQIAPSLCFPSRNFIALDE